MQLSQGFGVYTRSQKISQSFKFYVCSQQISEGHLALLSLNVGSATTTMVPTNSREPDDSGYQLPS